MQVPHPHEDVQIEFERSLGDGSAADCADVAASADASWQVLPEGACAAHHVPQDWREVGPWGQRFALDSMPERAFAYETTAEELRISLVQTAHSSTGRDVIFEAQM